MGGALLRGHILQKHWPYSLSPPLIIKGVDLEEHLYSPLGFSLGTRTSSDWDLLIPEPMYTQVALEWTRRFGPALEPQSVRLSTEAPHELGFYIEGFLFELHRDPAPTYFTTVNGKDVWDHRIELKSSWDQPISRPSEVDRLIIWLINYAKSGGSSRLLDWIDFILILNALTTKERQQVIYTPHMNSELQKHGLHLATKEAVFTIRQTPLYHLIELPKNLPSVNRQEQFNFAALLKSLNRYRSPLRVAVHQVKYCHPQLRAEYIRRAIIKLSRSMITPPATSKDLPNESP